MSDYLIFGDVDTRDYGVAVFDMNTDTSPTRTYEKFTVPGRDGDLLRTNSRLENKTMQYMGIIYENFEERLIAFRDALMGQKGYKRLSDSIHEGEFCYGMYAGPFNPKIPKGRDMGKFMIEFSCKPQRYLTSGQEMVDVDQWGETTTVTGGIATFTADNATGIKSLTVPLSPVQSGSGDPSPSNVRPITGHDSVNVTRTGKNMMPGFADGTTTSKGITFVFGDGTATDLSYTNDISFTGTSDSSNADSGNKIIGPNGDSVGISLASGESITVKIFPTNDSPAIPKIRLFFEKSDNSYYTFIDSTDATWTWTAAEDATISRLRFRVPVSGSVINLIGKVMIVKGATAPTEYEAYSGNIYPVSFGSTGTVYGGTVDVMSGVLTVTHALLDLSGKTWTYYSTSGHNTFNTACAGALTDGTGTAICDRYTFEHVSAIKNQPNQTFYFYVQSGNARLSIRDDTYTDAATFVTAISGMQLVYPLATPQTYQLTPAEVTALVGENCVWSDVYTASVEYGVAPGQMINPTMQTARPLIRVYGYGTVVVGEETITIAQYNKPYVDIDCDVMDCYYNADNLNAYVSFQSHEFPTLHAGITGITYSGSITKVEVMPRWWRA